MDMEVDTGVSFSVISEATYAELQREGKLTPLGKTDVVLHTYTGEKVKPMGPFE